MGEHFFGLHSGHLTARADAIARTVGGRGCGHVNYTEPNGERRGWFFAPNLGAPHDEAAARRVWEAIDGAGGIDALRLRGASAGVR